MNKVKSFRKVIEGSQLVLISLAEEKKPNELVAYDSIKSHGKHAKLCKNCDNLEEEFAAFDCTFKEMLLEK